MLRVGKVDTYVAEAGAGQDVLFVHGNPDSHDVWSEVVHRLKPRARCIAFDLPDWGRSVAHEKFDCSLESQAAFVRGVADGLGLDQMDLVVHDIGGLFGLSFATLHPERVRTLTIFNTSYFPDYIWHPVGRIWRVPLLGELAMLLTSRASFVGSLLASAPLLPRAYAERAYDSFTWKTRRMVLRYYAAMDIAKVMPGWDTRMLAAMKAVPKQVIWGDKDPFVSCRNADRYEAPVHHLADCSHWPMAESPDACAELIAALISKGIKCPASSAVGHDVQAVVRRDLGSVLDRAAGEEAAPDQLGGEQRRRSLL
jgi:pimeloyl-ACP methyl ester carboxylesterase